MNLNVEVPFLHNPTNVFHAINDCSLKAGNSNLHII